MIELRSDTFTQPTSAMREAPLHAVLGDDGYGEDTTVLNLERLAAQKLGLEATCFMPSGIMANLTAQLAHCPRGSEILVSDESDIYNYEAGGASIVGGLVYHPVPTQWDGTLLLADLSAAIRDAEDAQCAPARLICLENTHNRAGGTVLSLDYLRAVRDFAQSQDLAIHMDGARLFNAAVALNVSPAEIVQYVDSVQFCLSKGLSAPIGSMLGGSAAWIKQARRLRKMLGGTMRQVGFVAATGIIALETMVERLSEDHANARRLALALAHMPGVQIDLRTVQTNIVIFRVTDPRFTWRSFLAAARREGVALGELGHGRIRAVTHYGISADMIDAAIAGIDKALKQGPDPVGDER